MTAQTTTDPRAEFERDSLEFMDALYGNAMRLTRSAAEAEDLVQETYLRAYRFYDKFERGTNLRAWLFRIQYNTFVNHYRRKTKAREIGEVLKRDVSGEDVIGRETLRGLTDPTSTAMRPVLAAEIERALDELPDDHRQVVVLSDVEGLSYREIADIVGCPIGTVMSRLHRARRTLRKHLLEQAEHFGLVPKQQPASASEPVSIEAYRRERSGG